MLKGFTIAFAVVAISCFVWFLMSTRDIDRAVFETEHLAGRAEDTLALLVQVDSALNYTVESIITTTAAINADIARVSGDISTCVACGPRVPGLARVLAWARCVD